MRVIALGRFLYGIVLLGLGLTIFNLIGKNLADELLALVNKLHISSHVYYVHWLLQKISTVSVGFLVLITVVNFFYAALAFVEALGLTLGKRWCYWLVIWDTASFLPVETYQLIKAFDWVNFMLFMYYLTTVSHPQCFGNEVAVFNRILHILVPIRAQCSVEKINVLSVAVMVKGFVPNPLVIV